MSQTKPGNPAVIGGRLESEIIRALVDFNIEKKRVQTIIEGMGNGVMVTNKDLEVILHNSALLQLLELREEIKTPTAVTEIIKEEALISTLKKMLQGHLDGCVPITQEIRIGERTLRAVSTPSLDVDRNVLFRVSGTVTVFEEVKVCTSSSTATYPVLARSTIQVPVVSRT